jgi:outer membrane protein assembly factor BamD
MTRSLSAFALGSGVLSRSGAGVLSRPGAGVPPPPRGGGGGGARPALLLFAAGCASTPPFQGMSTDQIFEAGVAAFESRDWDDAKEAFERVLTTDPGFAHRAEARMFLARAHFEDGEYILAANEFELVLLRHPNHALAPEASFGICRSYVRLSPIPPRDQEYTRRAQDRCRQTAAEFRGHSVADSAETMRQEMTDRLAQKWYDEGRFYQRRNMHASALIVFQDVVDFYPQTAWAPRALFGLYRSYEAMGWEEEMDEVAERILFLYPDSDAAQRVSQARADGNGPGQ